LKHLEIICYIQFSMNSQPILVPTCNSFCCSILAKLRFVKTAYNIYSRD
jgi:hypothetical protein